MAQPVKWPDGARCAIMMTFDLDGETPWINRDPALAERPLHMSMGAYGPKTGMPRILDALDRYGIKTCIFIPGWIVERYPALCEDIVRRGHEVGHHGYLHEKPFFLKDRDEEEELLVKSLDIFKKILGVKPLGSRSPSAYMPSNSSDQISQTSSWLQMPLPTGGTELNRKKGASLLHQAVGNSTSGPWGVSWQYGRSVSRALL